MTEQTQNEESVAEYVNDYAINDEMNKPQGWSDDELAEVAETLRDVPTIGVLDVPDLTVWASQLTRMARQLLDE